MGTDVKGKRLRTIQLIESLEAGGAENLAVEIANELAARGHESHLVVLQSDGPFQSRVSSNVQLHSLDVAPAIGNLFSRAYKFFKAVRSLRRVISLTGANVVQTHLPKANFLGLTCALTCNCRVFPTVHNNREFDYGNDSGPLKTSLRKRAYRQMLTSCASMIAVSEAVRIGMMSELQIKDGEAQGIRVVNNGVRVPELATDVEKRSSRLGRGLTLDDFVIVAVGRLVYQKDFLSLVRALARANEDLPPWKCLIAGEGELRGSIEKEIEVLGLSDRISLVGIEKDVSDILRTADVFCIPSRYEGLPLVMLEAMAAGIPVCAFSIDGISEILTEGKEGMLAQPQDIDRMAELLVEMAGNPVERRAMGEAARSLVIDGYDFDRVVSELEEIYSL
ncbi:MAG: glycosyltransferase involved in cell wall biosynthesis [Candidatus Krumholzibacteriia bacterium]